MSESTERLIELGSAIDNDPYLVAERDDLLAVLSEVERLREEWDLRKGIGDYWKARAEKSEAGVKELEAEIEQLRK